MICFPHTSHRSLPETSESYVCHIVNHSSSTTTTPPPKNVPRRPTRPPGNNSTLAASRSWDVSGNRHSAGKGKRPGSAAHTRLTACLTSRSVKCFFFFFPSLACLCCFSVYCDVVSKGACEDVCGNNEGDPLKADTGCQELTRTLVTRLRFTVTMFSSSLVFFWLRYLFSFYSLSAGITYWCVLRTLVGRDSGWMELERVRWRYIYIPRDPRHQ